MGGKDVPCTFGKEIIKVGKDPEDHRVQHLSLANSLVLENILQESLYMQPYCYTILGLLGSMNL